LTHSFSIDFNASKSWTKWNWKCWLSLFSWSIWTLHSIAYILISVEF